MADKAEKLLPCPRCGASVDVSETVTSTVICPECMVQFDVSGDRAGQETIVRGPETDDILAAVSERTATIMQSTRISAPPSAASIPARMKAAPAGGSTVLAATRLSNERTQDGLPAAVLPTGTAGTQPAVPSSLVGGSKLDNYRVEKELGRGAMGIVLLARDTLLDRKVALKFMAPELASNEDCLERFIREGRLLARLKPHKNLVAIYAGGQWNGLPYFALELIEGRSVREVMRREGAFHWRKAVDICRQAAEALDFVWNEAKLIHRDIKPSNLMFDSSEAIVKVTDFGLARPYYPDDTSLTRTGVILGTPDYIAPEQAKCEKDLDLRTDIYALGATLFHLVAGRPPFTGDSIAEVVAAHLKEEAPALSDFAGDIPAELNGLVRRMLAKNREARPADYSEVIRTLAALED